MTTLPQTTTPRLSQGPGPMPPASGVPQIHAGANAAAAQMTPADVWRVIRGNIWWMILLTIVGGGVAYGIEKLYEQYGPKYTATGLLQVTPPPVIDPTHLGGDTEWAQTTLMIEQHTQQQLLRADTRLSDLIKSDVVRETRWFKEYYGDPNNPTVRKAKEYLKENIVVTAFPDSALLGVNFTYSVPADCKTVVEELVRLHLDEQRKVAGGRLDARTRILRELSRTLNDQLKAVSDRRRNQLSVLTQKGMSTPGTFGPKERELGLLVEAQLKTSTSASEAKNMFDRVAALVSKGDPLPEVEKAIENDQSVAGFVRDVSTLNIQRDLALDTYDKNHQIIKRLDRSIELTQNQLDKRRQELRVKYNNQLVETLKGQSVQTQADLDTITKRLEALRTDLADLGKEVTTYLIAQDEEKGLREQHTLVENRLRDIELSASADNQMRISWAQHPETPDVPSFPQLRVFLPAGLVIGLALALGLAFLREFLDQSVRSPRDIARAGHMNVLGIIADESDDPQVVDAQLAIYDAPHSLIAEQFRQVRTRLQHVAPFDSTRSMLVSGPSPLDGKTTVAANLAAGLALNGRKVLLVDSNFRRPEIHRIFGAENNRGFSDVLNGSAAIADAAIATRIPNLSILPSGAKPMNATELFESQLLSDFIDHANEEYDHVIFDSGPFLVVAEAAALAAKVDGVVTVVRAHADSRGKLQRMCDELRKVRAEHLGVVLNAVQAHGGGYYRKTIKTFYDYQGAA
ncbi:MAG: polysaccharide biosynthesis tyrosine autokinase [Tepidisphaerales bacterium]